MIESQMAPSSPTVENYLKAIFQAQLHLSRKSDLVPMGQLASALGVVPGTATTMVKTLADSGLVKYEPYSGVALTRAGEKLAALVLRRHRLVELFLVQVMGLRWDEVHEEAERLEHAMSPVLEERMQAAIGKAETCPHGHPIVAGARLAGVPLADVQVGAKVRVLRFENEAEDLLHYLKDSGLEPGLEGTLIASDEEQVVLQAAGGRSCAVTPSVAETVSVLADPSPPPRTALPERLVLGQRYGR